MSELTVKNDKDFFESIHARAILWDDPLLQIYRKNQIAGNSGWSSRVIRHYRQILAGITNSQSGNNDDLSYGKALLNVLIHKLELMEKVAEAYKEKNNKKLEEAIKFIPVLVSEIENFIFLFRSYQYARYNPQGFEIFQVRLGGQKERLRELRLRLEEYISGKVYSIPELHESASYNKVETKYHFLATASYFL
jgi:hypothetical protein